jgi:uncharacterized membrane protein
MSDTPAIALTIAFWLHMLATVSWVGGIAILSLVVIPLSRKTLALEDHHKLLTAINRRMTTIGGISLAILIGTGLFQMSANSNYTGLFGTGNQWAVTLFVKHIAFVGILGLSAYQTWSVAPAIERILLLQARGKASEEDQSALRQRELLILRGNVILSVIVLLLTALARIAN